MARLWLYLGSLLFVYSLLGCSATSPKVGERSGDITQKMSERDLARLEAKILARMQGRYATNSSHKNDYKNGKKPSIKTNPLSTKNLSAKISTSIDATPSMLDGRIDSANSEPQNSQGSMLDSQGSVIDDENALSLVLPEEALPMQHCKKKRFSLETSAEARPTLLAIINGIALTCKLSLIIPRGLEASLRREVPYLHVKKLGLKDMLELLLTEHNIAYHVSKNAIILSSTLTQTFHINYVASKRLASSLTDVMFTQSRDREDSSEYGDEDSSSSLGKSGSSIQSLDNLDFFATLKEELLSILDTKEISINPQAGLITISATPDVMKKAAHYLDLLNAKMQQQVLIEVNILSLKHKNSKTAGINWDKLYGIKASFSSNRINVLPNEFALGDIIKFLNGYGKVSSISNPKILTLNNQPALISVGSILRYKLKNTYQSANSNSTIYNTNDEFPSEFVGILLDVTPSIYGKEVILRINPSITKTKNIDASNAASALPAPPNLSTSQLSSIVRLNNGERVILGGLISSNSSLHHYRFPILGYIPLLDTLFSFKARHEEREEIVIIITPHIIESRAHHVLQRVL